MEVEIGKDLREVLGDGRLGSVVHHHHLRAFLGIKKLPKDSVGPIVVGDTEVYLLSSHSAGFGKPNVRRPHRVVVRCNYCRRDMSAGRFGQHLKSHGV